MADGWNTGRDRWDTRPHQRPGGAGSSGYWRDYGTQGEKKYHFQKGQHGQFSELGFTERMPEGGVAPYAQFESERIVAERNARLMRQALGTLAGTRRYMESYRPGGAVDRMAPIASNMAQVLAASRTEAPDLMWQHRDDRAQRARKQAKQMAKWQAGLSLIPTVGAIAASAMGAPTAAGAAGAGAAGTEAGGAQAAANALPGAPASISGAPAPAAQGGPAGLPPPPASLGMAQQGEQGEQPGQPPPAQPQQGGDGAGPSGGGPEGGGGMGGGAGGGGGGVAPSGGGGAAMGAAAGAAAGAPVDGTPAGQAGALAASAGLSPPQLRAMAPLEDTYFLNDLGFEETAHLEMERLLQEEVARG